MFWQVKEIKHIEPSLEADDALEAAGRFVLHRHRDGQGPHLDLRLENGDCLVGWRVAGERLETGAWATEKMPHPRSWLESDRDAHREKQGIYGWRFREENRCAVVLTTEAERLEVELERCWTPSVETLRALATLVLQKKAADTALPGLVEDGLTARSRAVERFCGLSRTMDGDGFDETGWRRLLQDMTLAEIGERLAKVEARYDRVHPPLPVSRPETIEGPNGDARARTAAAFRIADGR